MSDVRRIFTEVYDHNVWRGDESRSGEGSSVEAARHIVRELPGLLRDLGVRTLLRNSPCGDFTWMKEVDLGDIDYIGVDVVGPLVEANNARYGSDRRSFRRLDMLADAFAEGGSRPLSGLFHPPAAADDLRRLAGDDPLASHLCAVVALFLANGAGATTTSRTSSWGAAGSIWRFPLSIFRRPCGPSSKPGSRPPSPT